MTNLGGGEGPERIIERTGGEGLLIKTKTHTDYASAAFGFTDK